MANQTGKKKSASAAAKKKPAAKRAAPAKRTEKTGISPQKRQRVALFLFVIAVLLLCLIFISGESVWKALHNFILGLFGHSAVLWPILLIYIALTISFEKSLHAVRGKLWLCTALICSVTTTFFVFRYVDNADTYWNQLGQLFKAGYQQNGSGLISGILGIPIMKGFGNAGARAFTLILDFLFLMLLTGTGLAQLVRWITAPAKAVSKTANELMNDVKAQKAQKAQKRAANIDIPLDDEPEQPENKKLTQLKDAMRSKPAALTPAEPEPQPAQPEPVKAAPDHSWMDALDDYEPEEPDVPAPQIPAAPPEPADPLPESEMSDPGDLSDVFEAIQMLENPQSVTTPEPIPEPEAPPAAEPSDMPVPNAQPPENEDLRAVQPEPMTAEPFVPDVTPEPPYRFPPVTLLDADTAAERSKDTTAALQATGAHLIETLKSFGVSASILNICHGPTVTRYELQPAAGVKISRITNLADDIALNLASAGVRIEAPIPNKAAIGIEVPNRQTSIVKLRGLVESDVFKQAKSRLTVALGKDIGGNITLADLSKMPHLLIAGATGSGKSVCINSIIVSLLYKSTPDEVKLLMVDPKVVELGVYNGIPHLLVPVVTDPRKAAGALNWAVGEMLARYKTFAATGVRDLTSYNHFVAQQKAQNPEINLSPMPQIVIIVDELSDLMMAAPNEVEDAICRLAQMARAAGMHLVIATQRPSVDVITGVIKANIPSRIAFAVSSQVDSRTILDASGAEKLIGRGDMLFAPIGASKPTRVQGCFVSESEIEQVVGFIKKSGECTYDETVADEIERRAVADKNAHDDSDNDDDGDTDPMLEEAVKCVSDAGQASTSLLQRKLRLGYARAGRLIDEMENRGVVGPHEGSKPRQVLMSYAQWMERERARFAQAESDGDSADS